MIPMGASEIATAVGLGRRRAHGRRAGELYQSVLDLALRLRGEIPRYDIEDPSHDAALGRISEPGIGLWYAQREGLVVGRDLIPGPQIPAPGYATPEIPWLAVRPDFLDLRDNRTIEVKSPEVVSEEDGWGIPGTDEIPAYYYCQVAAQVAVFHRISGVVRGDLVVVARSARSPILRAVYTYHRDPAREARLIAAAAAWYQRHVTDRIDPDPDGSESAGDAIARRWRPTDTTATASSAAMSAVARIREIDATTAALDLERGRLTQSVQSEVGPASVLVSPDGGTRIATWRARRGSSRIDLDRLRSDHPDIAAKYTIEGQPGRTWRLA